MTSPLTRSRASRPPAPVDGTGDAERTRPDRPFHALEDAIAHAGRPGAPMVIGCSLCLDGRIDADLLDRAVVAAAAHAPTVLARRSPGPWWQRWPSWTWHNAVAPSVEHRRFSGPDADVDAVLTEQLARPCDLTEGPLARFVHLQGRHRDSLVLTVHHAAVDGVGALVLLQEVAAACRRGGASEPTVRGVVDQPPSPSAPCAPDGASSASSSSSSSTGSPARAAVGPAPAGRPWDAVVAVLRPPVSTRLHTRGATAAVGGRPLTAGVTTRSLGSARTSALLGASTRGGATVTDLLVAALHLAVADWNAAHGDDARAVSVTVPVRSRSAPDVGTGDGAVGGVGGVRVDATVNRTLQVTTWTHATDRVDPTRTVRGVGHQLAAVREASVTPHEPAALGVLALLPERIRARVPALASWVTGDRFVASSRLSNLGSVPVPSLDFGAARTTRFAFVPPARMPQAVTLGVVGYDGGLEVALRWCRPQLDATEAAAFLDVFVAATDRVACS